MSHARGLSNWAARASWELARGRARDSALSRLRASAKDVLLAHLAHGADLAPLPRWDDVCVLVLDLFCEAGLLDLHAPEQADEMTMQALTELGLIEGASWSCAAVPVTWRVPAAAWDEAREADPRFANGLSRCLASMDDVTRASLLGNTMPDMADALAQADPDADPALMEYRLRTVAEHSQDWLFYEGWRLDEGWLTCAERRHALPVFHDPLAQAMRAAVVAHLQAGAETGWEIRI